MAMLIFFSFPKFQKYLRLTRNLIHDLILVFRQLVAAHVYGVNYLNNEQGTWSRKFSGFEG